jgi:DUF4097 and DUF4098 domain-containing protein YvlB
MKHFIFTVSLLILLCTFNFTFAEEYTLIEKTMETSFYKNLDVKTVFGDVTVNTWDLQLIDIAIKGNLNAVKNIDYTIDVRDSGIFVNTFKKGDAVSSPVELKLRIEITVPKFYHLALKSLGGDIKVSTITGLLKIETAAGNINVSYHTGDADLKTAGGDIKDVNFRGKIVANSAGGDIVLDGSDGEINSVTAGGDIKLTYAGTNKGITLTSNGGNIKVYLPEFFKATLDITATGGQIKSDYSLLVKKDNDSQVQKGDINGGGNTLKCLTKGGKITLIK